MSLTLRRPWASTASEPAEAREPADAAFAAIDAQTLPPRNPSTRLLETFGCRAVGASVDRDGGATHRWRLRRASV